MHPEGVSPVEHFLAQVRQVTDRLDPGAIEAVVEVLSSVRQNGGRVFCLGSGGGAGHASHAVCDFRKLCALEAYCPTDNVSELTARINDEGWESSLAAYLSASRLARQDALFVFSVGGGSVEPAISMNLVRAIERAREVGARVVGIVGRDGGYTARHAEACIVVPVVDPDLVTPLTEGFQAILWHLLVSHPRLQRQTAKWESQT